MIQVIPIAELPEEKRREFYRSQFRAFLLWFCSKHFRGIALGREVRIPFRYDQIDKRFEFESGPDDSPSAGCGVMLLYVDQQRQTASIKPDETDYRHWHTFTFNLLDKG